MLHDDFNPLTLFAYVLVVVLGLPVIYLIINEYLFETEHIFSNYLKKFEKYQFAISFTLSVLFIILLFFI